MQSNIFDATAIEAQNHSLRAARVFELASRLFADSIDRERKRSKSGEISRQEEEFCYMSAMGMAKRFLGAFEQDAVFCHYDKQRTS